MLLPGKYSAEELEQHAQYALERFVRERLEEGTGPYRGAFQQAREVVAHLFEATDNLRNLTPEVVAAEPELLEAARYLGGPPLSQDDLDTLAGASVAKRKHLPLDTARKALVAVKSFLDPFRCPWLGTNAPPSPSALEAAINWTASLWAVERCRTMRRGTSSAVQEKAVAAAFRKCKLEPVSHLRRIRSLDELPRRHFTREVVLGTAKADLALRLSDGRLLAVECKVSNSALNSVKRLNRETVGKAENWRTLYGQQVITAAVLAGVFKVSSLIAAQEAGVFLFWEHDLHTLTEFVRRCTKKPEQAEGVVRS